jgi:hypothetical protein
MAGAILIVIFMNSPEGRLLLVRQSDPLSAGATHEE